MDHFKMKYFFLFLVAISMNACGYQKKLEFDNIVTKLILYNYDIAKESYSDDIKTFVKEVVAAKPIFKDLTGTDVNSLCELLEAAELLQPASTDELNEELIFLKKGLLERVSQREHAFALYQDCRSPLSLTKQNDVKRY